MSRFYRNSTLVNSCKLHQNFQFDSNNLFNGGLNGNREIVEIDVRHLVESFVGESIAQTLFGDVKKAPEIIKICKVIDRDLLQASGSIRFFLHNLTPNLVSPKIFSDEVQSFLRKNERKFFVESFCNINNNNEEVETSECRHQNESSFQQLMTITACT